MRGQILGVDLRTGEGQLAGDDGRRYRFRPEDWAHRGEPAIGLAVDFEPEQTNARSIFPLPGVATAVAVHASPPRHEPVTSRNKIAAALLALFLGVFGVHRFYLGRIGSGIVMLLLTCTFFGMLLSVPWALIDMLRYAFMSDREFAERYGDRR